MSKINQCNLDELGEKSLKEINGGVAPWVVRYGPVAATIAWERAVALYNDWDAIVDAFWEGWESGASMYD